MSPVWTLSYSTVWILLVLGERGYVPFSKLGAELLFEVVSRDYERPSLIVTTNLPFPIHGRKCSAPSGSRGPCWID